MFLLVLLLSQYFEDKGWYPWRNLNMDMIVE